MHEPGSRTSDYDYDLPERLIAQEPVEPRDASRLLVVNRATGALAHRHFRELVEYVAPGDTLVVNATQVFRARLLCTRDSGAPAEVFLLRPLEGDGVWEAMVQPGSKIKPGRRLHVAPGFDVDILDTTPRHTRVVQLRVDATAFASVGAAIDASGHVPLPPYITRADTPVDAARYQTVYARTPGSVAAPTAGLHFTPELLQRLADRGVERAEVVLHVGAGTFRPVQDDDPSRHVMHEEWYEVPEAAARQLAATRERGGRIWAVGTTAVRTLESACDEHGVVHAGARETNLFIRPPQQFRVVDRLITNFHQPRSTLLMLVASATGFELMMRAYAEAVEREYRFLSYGDAMCIL
jgi:S-adenosylmethionine:tRNA ribosyltransferase-isomerase